MSRRKPRSPSGKMTAGEDRRTELERRWRENTNAEKAAVPPGRDGRPDAGHLKFRVIERLAAKKLTGELETGCLPMLPVNNVARTLMLLHAIFGREEFGDAAAAMEELGLKSHDLDQVIDRHLSGLASEHEMGLLALAEELPSLAVLAATLAIPSATFAGAEQRAKRMVAAAKKKSGRPTLIDVQMQGLCVTQVADHGDIPPYKPPARRSAEDVLRDFQFTLTACKTDKALKRVWQAFEDLIPSGDAGASFLAAYEKRLEDLGL